MLHTLYGGSRAIRRPPWLPAMAGYLQESDFVMVEEGDLATRDLLESLTLEGSRGGDVAAFFVADLGDVVRKHLRFLKALPRVQPFYAVKCNGSRGVVKTLAELGTGFDCASKKEIELVQSIGVPGHKIIYANPCKQISHIKYAARHGVQVMTFDNEVELAKVAKRYPGARMVLSIATDEFKSPAHLNIKFGATLKSCRHLLETAKKMNVEVIGISFHVGSACCGPQAFTQAIADARLVFEMGAELGYRMHLLDLGGGFPGPENSTVRFEELASVINSALDLYFPEGCGVEIIAEPGRYYVASSFTLAVNIIAKEHIPSEHLGSDGAGGVAPKSIKYRVNDGVYGAFNSVLFDNTCPAPVLQKEPHPGQPLYSSSLWGPACDGPEPIAEGLRLPDLQVGDWLTFENMGAYTAGPASPFSAARPRRIVYTMSRVPWEALQRKLLQAEEDRESRCKPLSCGWEIADVLCVTPVFTPTSII
ncbi:antizyme inhibitor 2 isoform X2 [Ornithorhynchus anatinus]|uniref:antizyme inhibitor 2 isoform X2 n=1 Tax=Ornithorhynchus anatinus TaxID=9258 RepID=UPI0010A8106D|nr:antizyme inhibitor 2 isoform X2 [Ornithorhynchus anatinus]